MTNLDTLKKLAEAATPGPWDATMWESIIKKLFDGAPTSVVASAMADDFAQAKADAAYIAAMSPDVCLKLIAEIRRLERNQPLGPTALCPVCKTNIGGR